MTTEDKNKPQSGKIITMKDDLERLKLSKSTLKPKDNTNTPLNELDITSPAQKNNPPITGTVDITLDSKSQLDTTKTYVPNSKSLIVGKIESELNKPAASNESYNTTPSALESLRINLPEEPSKNFNLQVEQNSSKGSGSQLKGFENEMELEGSRSVFPDRIPSPPLTVPASKELPLNDSNSMMSNQYGAMNKMEDIRVKGAGADNSNNFQIDKPQKKLYNKNYIILGVLFFIAILSVGGVIFVSTRPQETPQSNVSNLQEDPIDTTSNPTVPKALFQPDKVVQITPTANIRSDIFSALSVGNSEDLVQIDLVDSSLQKIPLEQIVTILNISIPEDVQTDLVNFTLYAVRDNQKYALGGAITMKDETATEYLDNWRDTVIQDLSEFTLEQEVRSYQNNPQLMMTTKIQNTTGIVFNNFYYNFTPNQSSIDITAKENVILVGSTQGVMNYLIQNVSLETAED